MSANPVLLEWLSSPIRYVWNENVCRRLIAFSRRVSHGPACMHHYLNLGDSHYKEIIAGRNDIKLKRYFYVLRPVLALRWLRLNGDSPLPMNFQELMAGTDLPEDIRDVLCNLLEKKAKTKELGTAPPIPLLEEFARSEFDLARQRAAQLSANGTEPRDEANRLFRDIVKQAAF